jgi:LPPG:FO 2-phospho-L-lactate transferase
MKLALLAGGTGGAKLAAGLVTLLAPDQLTIIANTADDDEFWGLLVSPDVDAILYRLAGVFNERTGFGVADDTFNALAMLKRLGEPTWFALGDFDIGLHLLRTHLVNGGMRLTDVVAELVRRLNIVATIVPMSDDRVRTRIVTDADEFSLQQWFVANRCTPAVRRIRFDGVDGATPAPDALRAVKDADAVIIGPSNPFISIDPILALLAPYLERDRVFTVSPIVGGRSLKGPTVDMLIDLGEEPTSIGVAMHYERVAATVIIDTADAALQSRIEALGVRVVVGDIVMADAAGERRVAAEVVSIAQQAMSSGSAHADSSASTPH